MTFNLSFPKPSHFGYRSRELSLSITRGVPNQDISIKFLIREDFSAQFADSRPGAEAEKSSKMEQKGWTVIN
jgi:hypothetical protein